MSELDGINLRPLLRHECWLQNTVITVHAMRDGECKFETNRTVGDALPNLRPSLNPRAAWLSRKDQEMKSSEDERPNRLRHIPIDLQEQEAVRRRAYEIYQKRGRQDGFELEDWFQAEAEVLNTQRIRKAA
jgi:hypothetical protein